MIKRIYWFRGITFVITHIGMSYSECKRDVDRILKKFSYRSLDGFTLGVLTMSKIIPPGFLLNATEATFDRTEELTKTSNIGEILSGK